MRVETAPAAFIAPFPGPSSQRTCQILGTIGNFFTAFDMSAYNAALLLSSVTNKDELFLYLE